VLTYNCVDVCFEWMGSVCFELTENSFVELMGNVCFDLIENACFERMKNGDFYDEACFVRDDDGGGDCEYFLVPAESQLQRFLENFENFDVDVDVAVVVVVDIVLVVLVVLVVAVAVVDVFDDALSYHGRWLKRSCGGEHSEYQTGGSCKGNPESALALA
jgi:hypothetical protein